MKRLGDDDYQRLLAFRVELRDFLRWSEDEAHDAGLTPSLHQLLLVVRGATLPTISDVAVKLHIRHNSAVELVHRAEAGGLVERVADPHDNRLVRLALSARGEERLDELTLRHLPRIASLAGALEKLMRPPARRTVTPRGRARRR